MDKSRCACISQHTDKLPVASQLYWLMWRISSAAAVEAFSISPLDQATANKHQVCDMNSFIDMIASRTSRVSPFSARTSHDRRNQGPCQLFAVAGHRKSFSTRGVESFVVLSKSVARSGYRTLIG